MQTHPKWKYHESGDSCIVADEAEEAALGEGWHDLPIEPAELSEREVMLSLAAAKGIKIDKRWSDERVKAALAAAEPAPAEPAPVDPAPAPVEGA